MCPTFTRGTSLLCEFIEFFDQLVVHIASFFGPASQLHDHHELEFKLEAIARCLLVDLLLDGLCFVLHYLSFLVEWHLIAPDAAPLGGGHRYGPSLSKRMC